MFIHSTDLEVLQGFEQRRQLRRLCSLGMNELRLIEFAPPKSQADANEMALDEFHWGKNQS